MRRWPSILLLLAFLALGSGGLEFAHNHQHLHDDAAHAAHAGHDHDTPAPNHTDANCFLHALLHVPILAVGWVPLLVFLGLFLAFLTLLATPLVPQRAYVRLDCRGPPAC